jgi:uncharacterized protein (TIGR02598 family)
MKHSNNGFTLIEILISMGILSLGLSGILSLFPIGLDAAQKAIEETNMSIILASLEATLQASMTKVQPSHTATMQFFFEGQKAEMNFAELSQKTIRDLTNDDWIPLGDLSEDNLYKLQAYSPEADQNSWSQYSYVILLERDGVAENRAVDRRLPLYNLTIAIKHNTKIRKSVFTKLFIPNMPTN